MRNNYLVYQKHAFRKHSSPHNSRSVINASLWDVMSTGLCRYSEPLIEANREQLQQALYKLFKNSVFNDAISLGTNQVSRVNDRFRLVSGMLKEVLGDPAN